MRRKLGRFLRIAVLFLQLLVELAVRIVAHFLHLWLDQVVWLDKKLRPDYLKTHRPGWKEEHAKKKPRPDTWEAYAIFTKAEHTERTTNDAGSRIKVSINGGKSV